MSLDNPPMTPAGRAEREQTLKAIRHIARAEELLNSVPDEQLRRAQITPAPVSAAIAHALLAQALLKVYR